MKLSDLRKNSGLIKAERPVMVKPAVKPGVQAVEPVVPIIKDNAEAGKILDQLFARTYDQQTLEMLAHRSPFEKANALLKTLSREALLDVIDLEKVTGRMVRVENGAPLNNVSRMFWIDPSKVLDILTVVTPPTYTYNPVEIIFDGKGELVTPAPGAPAAKISITPKMNLAGYAFVVNRYDSENGNTRLGVGINAADRFLFQMKNVNENMKIFHFMAQQSQSQTDTQIWDPVALDMAYNSAFTAIPDSDELVLESKPAVITGTNVRVMVYPIVFTELVKYALIEAIFADDVDGFAEDVVDSY